MTDKNIEVSLTEFEYKMLMMMRKSDSVYFSRHSHLSNTTKEIGKLFCLGLNDSVEFKSSQGVNWVTTEIVQDGKRYESTAFYEEEDI